MADALLAWTNPVSFARHKHTRPLASSHTQSRFDPSSGQIFSEVTIAARTQRSSCKWPRERVELESARRKNGKGAASLEDLALRETVRNIGGIEADVLAEIPWQVGRRIWKQAEAEYVLDRYRSPGQRFFNGQNRDLTTLSVWQAFASAYPDEKQLNYYRTSEIVPQSTFPEYIEAIASPSMQWLTCLTLSILPFSRADIMSLSTLPNLVALDISSTSSCGPATELVDDLVIRNWARHAQEVGAFAKLRVLILRHQAGVTPKSFEHLNSFPSLVLLGVKGCSVTDREPACPETFGWTRQDDKGLIRKVQRDMELAHTWDVPIHGCYETAADYASLALPHSQPEQPAKPLLNFRLGPTTNDVLFSSPLVFFRCQHHKRRNSDAEKPVAQASIGAEEQTQAGTGETAQSGSKKSKKRKLRAGKQIALGGFLANMCGDC